MSLKRVHTGYENNETYHDSQKIKIVIISDPIVAPGASSETQGQSVGSLMSRNACNGENGETGEKSPAAGDLNWMPKVAPWRLAILAKMAILAKWAILAKIATHAMAKMVKNHQPLAI